MTSRSLSSPPLLKALEAVNRQRTFLRVWVFFLDVVTVSIAGSTVIIAVSLIHQQSCRLLFSLVPIWVVLHNIWEVSRRTRDFLRATQRIRPGQYVLYLRGSDVDGDPSDLGFEDALVRALDPVGPTVAVDYPRWFRRSAAIRISPFPNHVRWTDEVGFLADDAVLVVFRLGPRRGYRQKENNVEDARFGRPALDGAWLELELMPEDAFAGRCVFCIGQHWDNRRLQRTNANGTLDLGLTTLLAEIAEFIPERYATNWPRDLNGSRWLWLAPSGRPVSPGEPDWSHSSWNTTHRLKKELSEILSHFGHPNAHSSRGSTELGIIISLASVICLHSRSLIACVSGHSVLITSGLSALLFFVWLHRDVIRRAYQIWKYGKYDNFVWPLYKFGGGFDQPERRLLTENATKE